MDRNLILARVFLGAGAREQLYDRLEAMIGNGLGLKTSLGTLAERMERRRNPLAPVLREVLARLNQGDSLDQALARFIPGEEVMLVRSGLDAGELPSALDRCAGLLRARRAIVSGVVSAVAYPGLLLGLLLAILLVVSRYVVPQLALLSNPEAWTGGAGNLYRVSRFVDSPAGIAVLGVLVLGFAVSLITLPHFTGPVRRILDRVPPWSFHRLIVGSMWLFTVAAMMNAGIQLSTALDEMAARPGTRAWLRERVRAISAGLRLGRDFGTALYEAGYGFPDPELVEDILIYATLPDFDRRLIRIASQWLEAGQRKIAAQARILNTACFLGILVLLVNVGLAVSSLQQQLGQSMAF